MDERTEGQENKGYIGLAESNEPTPIQSAGAKTRGSLIANRTPWLDLPEPWDNLEIKAWLDYPAEIAQMWTTPEGETPAAREVRTVAACKEVFLQHRGEDGEPWQDEDGPLPQPNEDEFWDRIPQPLARAVLTRFFEAMSTDPKSRGSRKKTSKRFRRR